ncbi:MAG TPA: terminase [Porticoccaceae bacterium]|nr:terminase [Porticoccaceae bacterium]
MTLLSELLHRVESLGVEELAELKQVVSAATAERRFIPNDGPQTDGYFSLADEMYFGGEAGGGKTSVIAGLAYEEHQRSLILRRINKDAKKIARDELIDNLLGGDSSNWNGTDLVYRDGKRTIDFGGCEYEEDRERYKGDPHDLIAFDEIGDFLESQYEFIIGWNRSIDPNQRCRVVCTGNPPTTAEGLWVIKYWGAWLDPTHPNPAKSGELRWYVRGENDEWLEVDGKGPHEINGEMVEARSRTFIRSRLSDNPYLAADGRYKRFLDSLPKELRDAYRDGKYDMSLKDHPFQMIPTAWVQAAQERWTPEIPDIPMTAISGDCAGGGTDANVIAPRYGEYFAQFVTIPGELTPSGVSIAGQIIANRRDSAVAVVDAGGGYGNTAIAALKANGIEVYAYKGSEGTSARTADGSIGFNNVRTAAYWKLREALDPEQPGGSLIQLPPSQRLLGDLTAVRFEERGGRIAAESKEKMVKRIGRSPDYGDAVVMAWWKGRTQANVAGGWQGYSRQSKVHLGRGANALSAKKARRGA